MDVEDDVLTITEQNYEMFATVPSSELQKICCRGLKDISSDTISVCVDSNSTTFKAEGDLGSGTAVMKEGVSINSCVSITSPYSLRYLAAFAKCATLCPIVLIQMGQETPLRLTYVVDVFDVFADDFPIRTPTLQRYHQSSK